MDEIEEIRSKIDLVQYISETVPLKKAGRNFKACCPFHVEKTPSFMVNPERQIWKCFGCQKSGDIFSFVMETERLEFGEALRLLAKKAGVTLQGYQPTQNESEKEKLYQINHLAAEFFHYLLLNHQVGKRALNYILQRGISRESLVTFKIGYSPPMWDGLQKYLHGKKGYALEDLEKAGLIIKTSTSQLTTHNPQPHYYDRFRDRLMFPLLDHRGNVCGFSGRVLDPTAKEAKYVNNPETLIYHKSELLYPLQITKEEIKKENSVVVVEGEIDAISSFQVGIKNIVAIKGSALTELQARLLRRFADNLVLSLDADAAGDMAARRGIEIADGLGFNIKVVVLEKYKDPDEAAQKEPEYFKEQIKKATNVYDFFLDSAFKRFRGQTPEEKKRIGQEMIPVLSKIEDEIVKDYYIGKLAQRLEVNEESIILQIEKSKQKITPTPVKSTQPDVQVKPRREMIEEYYLSLLFQTKKVERLLLAEEKPLFSLTIHLQLIKALEDYLGKNKKFSSQFFFKDLPAEQREVFDKLYLVDFGNKIEDGDWVEKEIRKTKNQLEQVMVREELQKLGRELRQEEKKEDLRLQKRIRSLTQKLDSLSKDT
ncbi:MAG: DNA primase [Patescibacteria group bacterium]|nr:DNA primase [Patescibacteria group bacterium]